VVLDDDPTGAQLLADVPVLLAWNRERIAGALEDGPSVHLLTNSRALAPDDARALVGSAAAEATAGTPDAFVVLRGDSTLRAHLVEEYLGLRDALAQGETPPLLLVPALPSAGRITVRGTHLIERGGARVPLDDTEYATDGAFGYRSARLLDWANERSRGFFEAADGVELPLDELRSRGGPGRLAEALTALAGRDRPAVCAPDAETTEDLERIAEGLTLALEQGVRIFVRCAPALVGVLSGSTAERFVAAPPAQRVLVVCGSHVPTTTAQLERLEATHPGTLVEADIVALGEGAPREVERLAAAASRLLGERGLAIVATPRARVETTLAQGECIARSLAGVVPRVDPPPDVVVAKGGITSATTLRHGLGADEAHVVGPLLPGASLWHARAPSGRIANYVVVPGNVGTDDLMADLVARLLASPTGASPPKGPA
jgi:uncharacterized protein YgbK (DUF1537 family)